MRHEYRLSAEPKEPDPVGALLLIFAACVAWVAWWGPAAWREWSVASYVEDQGIMESLSVRWYDHERSDTRGKRWTVKRGEINVAFKYTVGGREYASKMFSIHARTGDLDGGDAEAFERSHQPGAKTQVFRSASRPERAVLTRTELSVFYYLAPLPGLLVGLIVGFLLVQGARAHAAYAGQRR